MIAVSGKVPVIHGRCAMPEVTLNTVGPAQQGQTVDAPPVAPPGDAGVEVVPLPEVLRQIGRDSRKDPQQYLDETKVPLGGE
jgi:hypothetical protein